MNLQLSEPVILASGSPRRQELLKLLIPEFTVEISHVNEDTDEALPPEQTVQTLALRKAEAVAKHHPKALVIGSDTIVWHRGQALGKPSSHQEAQQMIQSLQGDVHQVYTGVCFCENSRFHTFFEVTDVRFAPMTAEEIQWYVSTEEPMDKAGGYGIQGYCSRFVTEIRGDYFNVCGFPVHRVYEHLKMFYK